jgi:glycine cleavage system H lipoate-binding protein
VRASDGIEHTVYCPMTGRVVSTNERLRAEPALVAREPEQGGWLFQLEPRELERETQNLVPVG